MLWENSQSDKWQASTLMGAKHPRDGANGVGPWDGIGPWRIKWGMGKSALGTESAWENWPIGTKFVVRGSLTSTSMRWSLELITFICLASVL
ncbi:hypothetical protein niasHS_014853 [Heterodera schachtii]|uniref:Uncharacterized protein n=1 Tax=Heterodera schachtii TaxID=97005 RepID=A0ABD2III3_HETSC